MKAKQVRDMSDDELRRETGELRRALFNLRLQQAIGQLEKPHKLRATRRDLARVLTILRQREIAAASKAPVANAKETR
jgi:large subunit ribosomal protein L29